MGTAHHTTPYHRSPTPAELKHLAMRAKVRETLAKPLLKVPARSPDAERLNAGIFALTHEVGAEDTLLQWARHLAELESDR